MHLYCDNIAIKHRVWLRRTAGYICVDGIDVINEFVGDTEPQCIREARRKAGWKISRVKKMVICPVCSRTVSYKDLLASRQTTQDAL